MTAGPSLLARLKLRLAGLPRSFRELDRALRLLAPYRRLGWFASGAQGARTVRGEPLPWWTYAAILWLDGHLRAAGEGRGACLELGSGSSTLWLARRFERVVSLEHDPRWYRRLRGLVPDHVDLRLVDAADPVRYVAALDEGEGWDLVVIDGRHRMACLARAAARLPPHGLVLLDDSDRFAYGDGVRAAGRLGLTRTDFFGFSPAVAHLRCTSIFSPRGFQPAAPAPGYLGHGIEAYREL